MQEVKIRDKVKISLSEIFTTPHFFYATSAS